MLGLHFFNPAPLMPLVEVVRGPQTDGDSVKRAVALMERWGKTPVVADDAPGFIVNRVNRPFTLEALAMLEAGEASIPEIDAALRSAGYPMGPFELMDLTGVDVTPRRRPRDPRGVRGAGRPAGRSVSAVGAAGAAGRGRPVGAEGGRRVLCVRRRAGSERIPQRRAAGEGLSPTTRDRIVERIELAIVNEAYRARDEGVASEDDIDRALRLGAGHPAGPFERWADRGGPTAIRDGLANHAGQGPRFVPAAGLNDGPV